MIGNFSFLVVALIFAAWEISHSHGAVFDAPNSTISDVTITGDVAEVTRSFVLKNPPEGLNSVVVSDLPNTLDERSIKVSGRGGGHIVSTEMSSKNPNRENDPAFSKLVTDLENLHRKLSDQIDELASERQRVSERFESMKQYIRHCQASNAYSKTIELHTEMMDFQEKETVRAHKKFSSLDGQTQIARETLETVSVMLNSLHQHGYYKNLFVHPTGERAYSHADLFPELRGLPVDERFWPGNNVQKTLILYFFVLPFEETGFDRELTFTLKYTVTPAKWQAEYDVRVESATTTTSFSSASGSNSTAAPTLRIGLYALVTQSSREDWVAAKLHLSTALPLQSIQAPPSPAPKTVDYEANAAHIHSAFPNIHSSYLNDGPPRVWPAAGPTASPAAVPSGPPRAVPGTRPSVPPAVSSASAHESIERARLEQARWAEQQASNARTMDAASVDTSGQGGSISAAVKFHLPYPVSVPSNHLGGIQPGGTNAHATAWGTRKVSMLPPVEPKAAMSTRLFIRDMVITPHLFTYAVPTPGSAASTAYLRAWNLPNASHFAKPDNSSMPLLATDTARVFIEDTYLGTTHMPRTQPGAALRLDLGQDRNIEIRSNFVTPRRSSRSEDKSGWFTTDKIKYKVEVAEYAFTVRSTHDAPHLVMLSDYLPKILNDTIKLELLQPVPASIVTLKPPGASDEESDEELQEMWSEADFIAAVLAHPSLAHPSVRNQTAACETNECAADSADATSTSTTANSKSPPGNKKKDKEANATKSASASVEGAAPGMKVFTSKGTRNLVWAQWVLPGQTITAGLKYRTIWPEEKNLKRQ